MISIYKIVELLFVLFRDRGVDVLKMTCMSLHNVFQATIMFLLLNSWFLLTTSQEIIYESPPISADGKIYGKVTVKAGEEPVDTVHSFCAKHGLPRHIRQGILEHACSVTECSRTVAMIFSTTLMSAGSAVAEIKVMEGEEPADIIDLACRNHGVGKNIRDEIINEACAGTNLCSRFLPAVFRQPIQIDGRMLDDFIVVEGEEPADALFDFAKTNSEFFTPVMKDRVLSAACNQLKCTRSLAIIFRQDIEVDGKILGPLRVWEGQEPADVLWHFGEEHQLPISLRRNMLASICNAVQEKSPCSRDRFLLYSEPVILDGQTKGTVEVFASDEPANVVYTFCQERSIPDHVCQAITSDVCSKIACRYDRALLFHERITIDGRDFGELQIFAGDEPADVVYKFFENSDLALRMRQQVTASVCTKVVCSRSRALLYTMPIVYERVAIGDMQVFDGEEPADAVHAFISHYQLPPSVRRGIMQDVCAKLSCARYNATIFDQPINIQGQILANLVIKEGTEPADAVHTYCIERKIPTSFESQILDHVCKSEQVRCRRRKAIILRRKIPVNTTTEDTNGGTTNLTNMVELEIFAEEEPIDQIHTFCETHSLSREWRRAILISVCGEVACTRELPAVYNTTVSVHGQHGVSTLLILEGEIPTLEIYKFVAKNGLGIEAREQLLADACAPGPGGLSCEDIKKTREKVVDMPILIDDRNITEQLIVRDDGQEPVDVVDAYCQRNNVSDHICKQMIERVCEETICGRRRPIVFRFPLINFTSGEFFGEIKIAEGEEAIDVIYRQLQNVNQSIVNVTIFQSRILKEACKSKRLQCSRSEPVLYSRTVIIDEKMATLNVWVGEEPVDQVHKFCLERNLAAHVRNQLLSEACNSPNVVCTRGQPTIFTTKIFDENGTVIGEVKILEGEETADVLERFRRIHNETYNRTSRNNDILKICKSGVTKCTRLQPALLSSPFTRPPEVGGGYVGVLAVLEGDGPADTVLAFARRHALPPKLRKGLVWGICENMLELRDEVTNETLCTRTQSLLFNNTIILDDGNSIGPIEIFDGTEPCDQIDKYTYDHGISRKIRDAVIQTVCASDQVGRDCGRTIPSFYSLNIEGTVIEFLEDHEAVDLLYKVFRNYGKKAYTMYKALDVVCMAPRVKCTRKPALLYSRVVQLPGIKSDRLMIWDDTPELADAIYWFGARNQMSIAQRFQLLQHLCNELGPPCTRTIAAIAQIHVNRDNNITCTRSTMDRPWDGKDVMKEFFEWDYVAKTLKLNRTHLLGPFGYGNASNPGPLIVDFEHHIAFPIMLLFIFPPIVACSTVFHFKQTNSSESEKPGGGETFGEKTPAEKVRRRRKRKMKVPTSRRGSRRRARTPDRIETSQRNEVDFQTHSMEPREASANHIQLVAFCKSCCTCHYCCGVARLPWLGILSCVAVVAVHCLCVVYVYADILNGFFILDPYVEAFKYYDENDGNYMGQIRVMEGVAPVEAVYDFAKEFGNYGEKWKIKEHILRRPKQDRLFQNLCEENEYLDCSRLRAREEMMQDVSISLNGYKYEVSYRRPENPASCEPQPPGCIRGDLDTPETCVTTCSIAAADRFCHFLPTPVPNCRNMVADAIENALEHYEKVLRWDGKDHYRALELTRDVSNATVRRRHDELWQKYSLPCYPGPLPEEYKASYEDSEKKLGRISGAMAMIDNPEDRDFYDQPCRVVFGAMCARTKPSGDMLIETLN